MRKNILLVVFSILLFSCGENNPLQQEEPDAVSEIISELNFATGTSNQTISFTTNKKWEASLSSPQRDVSWCTISPTSGNAGSVNITVSTTENTGYDDRSVTLTIKTGNTVKNIDITQKQKNAIIISKDTFNISEQGGTFEVEANTNVELEVSIPTDVTWIKEQTTGTKALTNKKIIFNVSANETYDERKAKISIKDKNSSLKQEITVIQKQKNAIIVTKNKFEIPEEASSFEIEVKSNVNIEIFIPDNVDWLHLQTTGTRAMTSSKYIFSVDENNETNDRQTIIYLKDKGSSLTQNIEIIQSGRKKITVNVETPGTLKTLLGNDYKKIKELIISGKIHGDDVQTLGEMSLLEYIDMTNLSIVDGGLYYRFIEPGSDNRHSTRNDVVPFLMFINHENLKTVLLPNTAIMIDISAFSGCKNLKNITIPNSYTTIKGAFQNCISLESIVIPEGVTIIWDAAFQNCYNLTSVFLPNSLKEVRGAFQNCTSLESIVIPEGVEKISGYTFWGCSSLTEIRVSIDNPYFMDMDGILMNKDQTTIVCYPKGRTLQSFTIPNSVITIGRAAFSSCSNLKSIIIPKDVRTIDYDAFQNSSLVSINLPDKLEKIGDGAFSRSKYLESLIIPNSLKEIGVCAFSDCLSLKSLTFYNNIPKIGNDAFYNCHNLAEIHIKAIVPPQTKLYSINYNDKRLYIPKGSKEAYQNSEYWKGFYAYIEE